MYFARAFSFLGRFVFEALRKGAGKYDSSSGVVVGFVDICSGKASKFLTKTSTMTNWLLHLTFVFVSLIKKCRREFILVCT